VNTPHGGALAAFRLDDPDMVQVGDPGGLLRQIASSAAQVRTSLRASEEAGLSLDRPRAIVVAAAGASAFAGDVLTAMCGTRAPVQVTTVRGHQLPGWVGAADLVIGVSASGKGGESMSLAAEAARRGCQFVGVGPAKSPFADVAARARGPYVPVPMPAVGGGRASLWGLTVPLLVVASRLGVLRLAAEEYEAAAEALEEVSHQCRPSSEAFVNPAKSLALDIAGTLPLVWGGSPLAAVAARRFAFLLALNAKYPALAGEFPAVAHGQVAILDGPFAPAPAPSFPSAEDLDAALAEEEEDEEAFDVASGVDGAASAEPRLVLIADPAGEQSAETRMRSAVVSLASDRGLLMSELVLEGESPLKRLASVMQMLDYTSAYLAIAYGLDPMASAARGDLRDLMERAEP
jgi:glucose/mannose-6-phosphate isomerase